MAAEAAAKGAAKKAGRGSRRGILFAALALVILAGGGGLAYARFSHPAEKVVPPVTVQVGEFTTNLADVEMRRIIQIDLTLSVAGPEGEAAVKDHLAAVQDAVNTTLHGFTAGELGDAAGLEKLRQALAQAVDEAAGAKVVLAVYLTRIVIQ
ncbi:MAG: flagellar basal body-associated FliL family protein [Clostridia bacterium]|nr:flagellar basal body-associated FliL family protein [Clostridia bacterium]